MRNRRDTGKRNRLCQPRRQTTPEVPPRRNRTHGLVRVFSWLSWRRSNITVRRSCIVTAKWS